MPESADVWAMRPKLRHDVVFLETSTGAYLRGADTAFLLKGRSAFRWLTTLSPYFTGDHTLEQMCASLDDGQRQTVAALVRALAARGFVKDAGERSAIPDPVARRFASQIEFIDHFADDATGRFLRFHQSRVVLGGAGQALLAAAVGLVRNGCATIEVRPEDDPEPYRRALRAEVEELRGGQVSVDVQVSDAPIATADADAVIYCADGARLPRLLELVRSCHADGPLLVPVVWNSRRAVLGPTAGAGSTPCWLCAHLRLSANSEPAAAAEAWRHLALGPVGDEPAAADEVAAQMVGNAAAFELFRALTGALAPETASSVVVLDLSTLESTREPLLRHPQCPVCRDVPNETTQDVPKPATEEDAYQRCEILVSPNTGVFTKFVDDPLEQAPLKTARLRVPPAVGAEGAREITAFDVHTVLAARLGAYRVAIRDYAGRIAEPESAVVATAAELTAAGRTPVPWNEIVTSSGAIPYTPERRLTWLPARVLGAEQAVWVPAALALPMSAANRDGYAERTVAGATAAPTVDEVTADGLAGAIAYDGLQAVMRGRASLVELSEADLISDDDMALMVKAAHRFGQRVRAFTVPAAAPVVLAVSEPADQGRPLWTVGAATTARQALHSAVRDLVGLMQVRHFEGIEADLGLPLLADFDPRTALAASSGTGAPALPAELTVAEILTALTARGLTAVQVDITPSDIRSSRAMSVGVVLLWRRDPAAN
jgi:bacteriocin biosynthesis cyclodehydratase domain-containing protein